MSFIEESRYIPDFFYDRTIEVYTALFGNENQDDLGIKLRKRLLEIYDKTIWNNDGWYVDDGLMPMYLGELSEITQNSGTILKQIN